MVASAFLLYFACVCGSRSAVAIGAVCLRSQRFQCARAFLSATLLSVQYDPLLF